MLAISDTVHGVKTYYLYIKTHRITGLKYLGQTGNTNPHKYKGSGVFWLRHLKKHGVDYDTEILVTTTDKKMIKEWGLYYSDLWNIVESTEWANLVKEAGDSFPVGCKRSAISQETKTKINARDRHIEKLTFSSENILQSPIHVCELPECQHLTKPYKNYCCPSHQRKHAGRLSWAK